MSINFNLHNEYNNFFNKNKETSDATETTQTSSATLNYSQRTKINNAISNFERGNLTVQALKDILTENGVAYTHSQNDAGFEVFAFEFQNKKYAIASRTENAISANDNQRTTCYTSKQLLSSYKFPQEMIDKYFEQVEVVDGEVTKYALKKDCGYKSISELKTKWLQETRNNLILNNFVKKDANKTDKYEKTSDGNTLTTTNLSKYANEINSISPDEKAKLQEEALEKFVKEFSRGNISSSYVDKLLKAINVSNKQSFIDGKNLVITFEFNNKKYAVTCNCQAAKSGRDSITDKNGTYTETVFNDDGSYSVTTYNSDGEVKNTGNYDKDGNIKNTVTFNADGSRTITETAKDNSKTEKTYDKDGNLKSTTVYNADGTKTTTYMDENNRIVSRVETDKDGNNITYYYKYKTDGTLDYFAYSERISSNTTIGHVTYATGEIHNDTYTDGKITKQEGLRVDGTKWITIYDSDWNKATEQTNYDKDGNIKNTVTFNADGSRTITETAKDNSKTEKTYDKDGNLKSTTVYNADGTKTTTYMDENNRIVSRVETDKDGNDITYNYRYKTDGSLYYFAYSERVSSNTTITHVTYATGEIHNDTYTDGKITKQEGLRVDGTKWITIYDSDWNKAVEQTNYDKDGNIKNTVTFNADGSRTITETAKDNTKTEKTYDKDGNLKSTTVYNSKGNKIETIYQNNVASTQYLYNQDGTVTMYSFGADGKKNVEIGTYKADELPQVNSVDYTKTTKKENSNGTFNLIYCDKNGKTIYTELYSKDGKTLSNRCYYEYGSDGKIKGFSTAYCDASGTVSSVTRYDKNWKTQTLTAYNADGTLNFKDINYQYDSDGNKIGYTRVKYDSKGNKIETIYQNNVASTQYLYNQDGTVTMYSFGADGKKNVEIGTYKADEQPQLNNVDNSKTTRVKNSDGTVNVTYRDKNGKTIYSEKYAKDEKTLSNRCYYEYGSDGKIKGFSTAYCDASGTVSSVTRYDKNWKTQTLIAYNANGTLNFKDINYQYDSDGNKIGYTRVKCDSKGNKIETIYQNNVASTQYLYNQDGTVTMYSFGADGKKNVEIGTYKADELPQVNSVDYTKTTKKENSNGTFNLIYCDKNGKTIYTELYSKDGKTLSNRCYYEYDSDGKIKGFSTAYCDASGTVNAVTRYDKNWKTQTYAAYRDNGSISYRNDYQYDSAGNKVGYISTAYNANGTVYSITMHEKDTPTKRQIYNYSGTKIKSIATQTYDAKNKKWVTASSLLNSDERDQLNNIKIIIGDDVGSSLARAYASRKKGALGIDFLYAAGAGHSLAGASKTIGYNDSIYKQYGSFLDDKIKKEITDEYSYTPNDIKGYYFNSSSDLSKKIVNNADFKNFVNKNIDLLKAGFSADSCSSAKGFSFQAKNSQELYYAISGVNVIKSWTDNNGKLHVILSDTYDFSYEGHGTSHGELCAAGDAAMKEGTLVPYYTLIEVVL